jgi:hypothetical protein
MSRSLKLDHFSRRKMLLGVLGGSAITVGLPWFESLVLGRGAKASVDGLWPQRFGWFFWGNGNRPELWTPPNEGTGFTLSETLSPLAGHEDVLTVLTGLSLKVPNTIPHWSGVAGLMAGAPAIGDDNDNWTVTGPSIDQVIADVIGTETLYKSLEVGVGTTNSTSFTGSFSQNPAEDNPLAFFDRIFGSGFAVGGGEPSPTLEYRRSVLDAVMADIADLQSVLGAADKARLDQHLTGVRDLETRLSRLQEDPPDMAACLTPATPDADYPDVDGRPPLSEISRVQADLIAMALACDQSRVFSFNYTSPLTNVLFAGAEEGHHNLTHDEPGDQPQVADIAKQVITEYAYLVSALRNIPEGDETLLDHCCVVAASETSEGRTHALDEMPFIYAGGACGKLATGLHHRSFTQENINKAVLSIQRAMGVVAPSWGAEDGFTEDGLSAIEV